MTNAQLARLSGIGLVAGAVVYAIHVVLRSVITAAASGTYTQHGSWVPINALGVLGATLVMLGLPAAYVRMARVAGAAGVIGVALLSAALMFFGVFMSLYGALILPWLAAEAPSLVGPSAPLPTAFLVAFIGALAAWLAGTLLLGFPFMRQRVRPRWVGYVLAASGIWMAVGSLVIAPGGPASNLLVNLVSNLGPLLLVAALGRLGYREWATASM